jgi:hypothetical protein
VKVLERERSMSYSGDQAWKRIALLFETAPDTADEDLYAIIILETVTHRALRSHCLAVARSCPVDSRATDAPSLASAGGGRDRWVAGSGPRRGGRSTACSWERRSCRGSRSRPLAQPTSGLSRLHVLRTTMAGNSARRGRPRRLRPRRPSASPKLMYWPRRNSDGWLYALIKR